MNVLFVRGVAAALLAAVLPVSANATPIVSANNWFVVLVNNGPSQNVTPSGSLFNLGNTSVTSPTSGMITGIATAPDSTPYSIPHAPAPARPDQYVVRVPFDPSKEGTWNLSFSDGVGAPAVNPTNTPLNSLQLGTIPVGLQPTRFVSSVYVTGTNSLSPTFHWSGPTGYNEDTTPGTNHINAYDVSIFDNAICPTCISGFIQGNRLAPSVHSFTTSYAFDLTHQYTIAIEALQTRNGATFGGTNLFGQSNTFFDFNPGAVNGGPAFYLPQTLPNGSFQYNMAVVEGQTYYIDPTLAIGYDFQIGVGDPNFASVLLPTGIGDNLFDIFGFDALNSPFLLAGNWLGGDVFNFGPGGVDRFRILGIEPSAGLDPTDTTAFVTGLTFTDDGQFTGTQTPITQDVPEPGTLLIFAFGLGGAFAFRRRVKAHSCQ